MVLRSFLRWTFFFVAVFLLLYIARNELLKQALRQGERVATIKLQEQGIELTEFSYAGADMLNPFLYRLEDVAVRAQSQPDAPRSLSFALAAEELEVQVLTTLPVQARVTLEQFTANLDEPVQVHDRQFSRIENARWSQIITLKTFQRDSNLLNVDAVLRTVEQDGFSADPFELSGDLVVRLNGHESRLPVSSTETAEGVRLLVDQQALKSAVAGSRFVLSDEEIALLSQNPLRIPRTIRLTSAAKARSLELANQIPGFPEDAFRHVYWSWLLTSAYGVSYAEAVTSAHETLPGNTPAERAMDFHNNEVGRRWAQEGIAEADLPELVRTSPDVIRFPQG